MKLKEILKPSTSKIILFILHLTFISFIIFMAFIPHGDVLQPMEIYYTGTFFTLLPAVLSIPFFFINDDFGYICFLILNVVCSYLIACFVVYFYRQLKEKKSIFKLIKTDKKIRLIIWISVILLLLFMAFLPLVPCQTNLYYSQGDEEKIIVYSDQVSLYEALFSKGKHFDCFQKPSNT